jgi:hypothetical protein
MPNVTIQLAENRNSFSPGERITGQVSWQFDVPPESAELRLRWFTDGRGIGDEDIVQTIPFPAPQATETRPFSLTLPEAPYSFTGTLITLSWSLEAVFQPNDYTGSVGLILAPGGEAISLPRVKAV